MITEDTFNKLKWQTIRRAQATGNIHFLINIISTGSYSIVNSDNTIIGPDAIIDFVGFKFSDTRKLIREGHLY